ncbi:ABC transporter permease [Thermus filiformis]|uniref:Sodium ABC transporter permease n=1 Tax=Thermus filiformis TaxID=276 RepID=A0A0A2WU37_THEFI|nr:ABC transporter permease subunit [Thermus filiformis]KGQ21825.1 sodium ABC transporter permease [Thermus filiformis]
MDNVKRIFRKEILSVLRERRVIFSTLILPILLMPLLMYGPSLLLRNAVRTTAEQVQPVGVKNLPEPALEALRAAKLQPVPVDDPETQVREKKLPAAVAYAEGRYVIYGRLSGGLTQSSVVVGKIEGALRALKEQEVARTLQSRGISPAVLEPFGISTQDASPKQERSAGLLAFFIPYFLVLFILIGGQVVAIDTTAGEKEKGTLEALLATPVPLSQIVLGKALATLVVALAAALSSVTGIVLGGTVVRSFFARQLEAMQGGGSQLGGVLALEPAGYLALLVTAFLFAAMMVSVQLTLGLYARSFKEAQSYMAPLQFVFILPLIALQFSDFLTQQQWYYALPAFNVMLLLDGLVKGSAQGWQIGLTWATTLLFALLALMLAMRSFRREEVVFRN